MDMKEYNFTIVRDEKIYPPITHTKRYVKNYLTAISKSHKGYAAYLEAKFLEYARVLHNGIVANSRTQVSQRRPVVNREKNREASGIKSGT